MRKGREYERCIISSRDQGFPIARPAQGVYTSCIEKFENGDSSTFPKKKRRVETEEESRRSAMVTYPVWPSRTFTRCKGHSNDLDKSSFRHDASLDADGSLRRRPARDGEKISPVCDTELEGAPGIVSAMILSGHDFAINLFRLPFSSHACDGGDGQNVLCGSLRIPFYRRIAI